MAKIVFGPIHCWSGIIWRRIHLVENPVEHNILYQNRFGREFFWPKHTWSKQIWSGIFWPKQIYTLFVWKSRDCALRIVPRADKLLFAFTAPLGLVNPMTSIHVRLLGPCFKTGRSGRRPTRQRDENRNRALLAIRVLSNTCLVRSQGTQGCQQYQQLHPGPLIQSKQFLS